VLVRADDLARPQGDAGQRQLLEYHRGRHRPEYRRGPWPRPPL